MIQRKQLQEVKWPESTQCIILNSGFENIHNDPQADLTMFQMLSLGMMTEVTKSSLLF